MYTDNENITERERENNCISFDILSFDTIIVDKYYLIYYQLVINLLHHLIRYLNKTK